MVTEHGPLRKITIKTRELEGQHIHTPHSVTPEGRASKLSQLQPQSLGVWNLGGICPFNSKSNSKLLFPSGLVRFLIKKKDEMYTRLPQGPELGPGHLKLPRHLLFSHLCSSINKKDGGEGIR